MRANDVQVNALMPAMQFSIAPWDLSKDAETMCQQAVELRERLLHTILAVAEEAGHALDPICRPMWWLDPEDEETYQIKDQFVVGNDLIVAPVVYRVRRGFDSPFSRLSVRTSAQCRQGFAGAPWRNAREPREHDALPESCAAHLSLGFANLVPVATALQVGRLHRTLGARSTLTGSGVGLRCVCVLAGSYVKERLSHSGRVAGPAQPGVYIHVHGWAVAGGV